MMGFQQRLKGAIDRTIAEEQARQEQARQRIEPGTTPRRSDSTSRSNQSPARRPRPKKAGGADTPKDDGGASPSNPDPAVFEAAFALDDSEEPSRAGTPKPAADAMDDKGDEKVKDKAEEGQNGEKADEAEGAASAAPAAAPELSPEVRLKLRKLEKLEKTYPGACIVCGC